MQKSAKRIFRLLFTAGLSKLLIFCGVILITSTCLLLVSLKSEPIDLKLLANSLNGQCEKDSSNRCFSNFFTSFAKNHSLYDSQILLRELQGVNPKTAYCHSIAHAISIAEVEKNPGQWQKVFEEVPDSECSYGYFHGVIEGKYRSNPELKIDNSLINKTCLNMKGQRSIRSCSHAFGHILLVQETTDIDKSLSVCESLENSIKSPCFQGVFMENVQRNNLAFHGINSREAWNENYLQKQKEFCNEFTVDKRTECWRSLGPAIIDSMHQDLNKSIAFCQSAPEYSSKRACNREVLGQNMVDRLASRVNNGIISDSCIFLSGDTKEYNECIQDLVGYVLLTSKFYKNQMEGLCQNTKTETKAECLAVMNEYSN